MFARFTVNGQITKTNMSKQNSANDHNNNNIKPITRILLITYPIHWNNKQKPFYMLLAVELPMPINIITVQTRAHLHEDVSARALALT